MNILHVTFNMQIGGTEMVIKSIVDGAADSDFCIGLFCIETPIGPWGKEMLARGISVEQCNRKSGFDISVVSKIRAVLKQHRIDIVHCHQYTPWVYGALASIGTPAKVIFTEHGRFYPDSRSWKRKIVNPLLLALTTKITAISEATKNALVEFEYLPRDKISVIYNGIRGFNPISDTVLLKQERDKLNINHNAMVFGTIARLDPIKNHTMMLRAFADALRQDSNLYLVIVGDGPERRTIESLIEELDLTHNVSLTGYKSDPSLYLNMFDVFLLSSLSEGTSMTLLEAMSLTKPCIVTDAGGNAEIIESNYNGLVTPNDDQDAFARAMVELSSQQKQRVFGSNGRARFERLFAAKHMCEKYEQLYLQTVKD